MSKGKLIQEPLVENPERVLKELVQKCLGELERALLATPDGVVLAVSNSSDFARAARVRLLSPRLPPAPALHGPLVAPVGAYARLSRIRRVARGCSGRFRPSSSPAGGSSGLLRHCSGRPPPRGVADPRAPGACSGGGVVHLRGGPRIATPPTGFPRRPGPSGFRVVRQRCERVLWQRQA